MTQDPQLADPKATAVLAILDALRQGDLLGLQRTLSPAVVLNAHGASRLAGTFQGAGGVLAYTAQSSRWFVLDEIQLLGLEIRGDVVTIRLAVTLSIRKDRWPVRLTQNFHFGPDGLVSRIEVEAEDQAAFDRLLEGQYV